MYQTIQLSSCISVQGQTVHSCANGEVVIRSGRHLYRGRPIAADRPLAVRGDDVPRSAEIHA